MKPPISFKEETILEQVALGEFDWLECKGSQEIDLPENKGIHKEGLAKAISALANSGGGYLILGVNGKTKGIDQGGVPVYLKPNGTKEWLESILPTLVDPPLSEFNVIEIKPSSKDSKITPDHAIYVVDIMDSNMAPHQSIVDNRYYHRAGSRSMPSNHRIVMDILGRIKHPNIIVSFSYGYVNDTDPNYLMRQGQHKVLNIDVENNGRIFAQFVNIILFFPKYLLDKNYIKSQNFVTVEKGDLDYCRIVRENIIPETKSLDGKILFSGPGRYTPILPGRVHSFMIPLANDFENHQMCFHKNNPEMFWELYADNMPRKADRTSMYLIMNDKNLPWE